MRRSLFQHGSSNRIQPVVEEEEEEDDIALDTYTPSPERDTEIMRIEVNSSEASPFRVEETEVHRGTSGTNRSLYSDGTDTSIRKINSQHLEIFSNSYHNSSRRDIS